MKIVSRRVFYTKLSVVFALSAFVLGVWMLAGGTRKAIASASGPTPGHTGALSESNCTSCHTDFPVNTGTGNVTMTGMPVNYLPGQQYQITVRVSQVGATIYGFQTTAIDTQGRRAGTFVLPPQTPARLQLDEGFVGSNFRQYIEHTVDGIIPQQFDFNTWTFTWTAPARRVGKINFHSAGNAANSDGQTSGDYIYTTAKAALSGSANATFDADGKSDFSVWRPSSGVWYSLNTANDGFRAAQFGLSGDRIVPGDYDADGISDYAVFRPSTGVWYVLKSTGGFIITQFGVNGDVPVAGDYDGDLKADIAVWRPSTGVWFILRSSNGSFDIRQFGLSNDKIAQGDYDGDAKTDVAVYRPSEGNWYIWRSTDFGYTILRFGIAEDKPVQADYDGDGRHDVAVFRPSTGVWYMLRSTAGVGAVQFGLNGDRPAPTDFDGDGSADVTVYRNGTWYALRSTDFGVTIVNFGLAGDIPVPGGYLAE